MWKNGGEYVWTNRFGKTRKQTIHLIQFQSFKSICLCLKVQTDFVSVDLNKFLITIQNADDINHVVVFMTGSQPFPEGMGGSGETSVNHSEDTND